MLKTRFLLSSFFLFLSISAQAYNVKKQENDSLSALKKAEFYLEILQKKYANGEYELHKTYSDSLLAVATKNGLTKMHILALNNQAVYYKNRSEKQLAITCYHKALEKCALIPDDYRSRTIVLVNMGNMYMNLGDYEESIATMEEVLLVSEKVENSNIVRTAALLGISNSYDELKDYKLSLEYLNKVEVLAKEMKNETYLSIALNNKSDLYIKLKEYQRALETTTAAFKFSNTQKPTRDRAWLLLNRGIANFKLKNYEDAKKNLLACEALSQEKNLLEIEIYAHEYLALIYEERKDFNASYKEQKEYSVLKEKYENDIKEATKTNFNKNIEKQNKIIEASELEVTSLTNNRKVLLLGGGTLLLFLSGLLFFFVKRKKEADLAQIKIKTEYNSLLDTKNTKEEKVSNAPYKNSSLTTEDREVYKQKILAFMKKTKPYLNTDLNQSDLAAMVEVSSHHFSEVLYYSFEQNFYTFINSYRILEAKRLIQDDKNKDAKMIAIAFDAGFKSKTSFNRVFKKETGFTPSEYKKSIS